MRFLVLFPVLFFVLISSVSALNSTAVVVVNSGGSSFVEVTPSPVVEGILFNYPKSFPPIIPYNPYETGPSPQPEEEEEIIQQVFGYTPLTGEPPTCGNGVIDANESYLNCNRDIQPTLQHYTECLLDGGEECIYFNYYFNIMVIFLVLAIFGSWLVILLTKNERVRSVLKKKKKKQDIDKNK